MKILFQSCVSLLLISFLNQAFAGVEISGYRDKEERVKHNGGIELLLFKKITDSNMEHFSIRNTSDKVVRNITGKLVYINMQGEVITTQPFSVLETLQPGESELSSIPSFDQNNKYSFHLNHDPRGIPPGVEAFMVKLDDVQYEIVE
jgi:hypothetical protein